MAVCASAGAVASAGVGVVRAVARLRIFTTAGVVVVGGTAGFGVVVTATRVVVVDATGVVVVGT